MLTPITTEGKEALLAELHKLKSEIRPSISQAIASAREHGDLKENAEYHAAREKQGFVESRIMGIESRLADSRVIDIQSIEPSGKVIFGVTVEIVNNDSDSKTYRIVGEDEANPHQGLISILSPVAQALIGQQVGDLVQVRTADDTIEYKIKSIQHL